MPIPSEAPGRDAADAVCFHLCRSVLYSAAALGFMPPSQETIERLCAAGANAELADAAAVLDRLGTPAAVPVRVLVRRLQLPWQLEALAASHRRLFGYTARGEVPAYETEYGGEALFEQPQELADLVGFMRAFGLRPRPEVRERVDHVSCECELFAFLACKEACALARGDSEMVAATQRAAKLFLRDHLGRFVPAFTRRVLRAQPHPFYEALARLLLALATADCRRLGIVAGTEGLGLRPDPAVCAAPLGCLAGEESSCGGGAEPPPLCR